MGIAEVTINGNYKGVLWTKPFRTEISRELQAGKNQLEIKVVNSWFNRVAGDEIPPHQKQFTTTNIVLGNNYKGEPRKEIPLEPSGLLGPVSIKKAITDNQ